MPDYMHIAVNESGKIHAFYSPVAVTLFCHIRLVDNHALDLILHGIICHDVGSTFESNLG
jgi:23S rRNA maturation-related 3'-5' exoribonuclease YhaM